MSRRPSASSKLEGGVTSLFDTLCDGKIDVSSSGSSTFQTALDVRLSCSSFLGTTSHSTVGLLFLSESEIVFSQMLGESCVWGVLI